MVSSGVKEDKSRKKYIMKVSQIIKMLKKDGWYLDRTKGSHRQFRHSKKSGLVTVSGKPSDEFAPGTLNSIFKQARFNK